MQNYLRQITRLLIALTFFLLTTIGQAEPKSETAMLSVVSPGQVYVLSQHSAATALPRLILVAGTTIAGQITIANNSILVTGFNIKATLPASFSDVTQDASNCAVLPPQSTCQISFIPGNTTHPLTNVPISGTNTSQQIINMAVVGQATLSLAGSPLTLTADGASGSMIVTNNSTSQVAALGVNPNFTGTALEGLVTVAVNTCQTVQPGNSCTITFTPSSTSVPITNFPIQGADTEAVTGAIRILPVLTTTIPSNQTVDSGHTATFSSTPSGGLPPYSYQWQVSTNGGSTFTNVTTGTGGTTATYTTAPLVQADSGNLYRVVVTDSLPQTVISGAAIVSVNAVLETSNPTSIPQLPVGQMATFSTTTIGGQTPYSYQWQVSTDGGVTFSNVSTGTGSTTATYTTAGLMLADSSNQYRVIVTDAFSEQVTSAAASVTLFEYAYFLNVGSTVLFTCPVNPGGTSFGTCVVASNPGATPRAIVINPSATFAYLMSNIAGTIQVCPIQHNATLGTCTTTASGFTAPNGIAVHPNGLYLYLTTTNGDLYTFDIDQTNGSLTNPTITPYTAGLVPLGIGINPSGVAYIGNEFSTPTTSSISNCPINAGNGVLGACVQTGLAENQGLSVVYNLGNNVVYMVGQRVSTSPPYYFYCTLNGSGDITACTPTSISPNLAPISIAVNFPVNPANAKAYIVANEILYYCTLLPTGDFGTCNTVSGVGSLTDIYLT